MIRTFETRIGKEEVRWGLVLDAYSNLMNRAERKAHALLETGCPWTADNYRHIYQDLDLTARLFLSVMASLRGKREAATESRNLHLRTLARKIKAKVGQIARKEKDLVAAKRKLADARERLHTLQGEINGLRAEADKPGSRAKVLPKLKAALDRLDKVKAKAVAQERAVASVERGLPQHRVRLRRLQKELDAIKARKGVRLTFGSNKLFKRQFDLEANGYRNHREWKNDWVRERQSSFMVIGDASYPSGNDFVQAKPCEDGRLDLEIRLPPALLRMAQRVEVIGRGKQAKPVGFITLTGLHFNIGHDVVKAAIKAKQPLTYRFLRDGKSWKVFVAVDHKLEWIEPDFSNGGLGVDLNVDHVACVLTDRHGNPVRRWTIPCVTYGLSQAQALDVIRKAADQITRIAMEHDVPVVKEILDFSAKKDALVNEHGARRARQLSSFAYGKFDQSVQSSCVRLRVALRRVNPAYTSLIGRVKTARRYGLSVHASAALAIARRAMAFSERLPPTVRGRIKIPLDGGGELAVPGPARIRGRHVWSSWRRLAHGYSVAHAAYRRAERKRLRSGAGRSAPDGTPRRHLASGVSPPARSTAAPG